MECWPFAKLEVVYVAIAEAFSVTVFKLLFPSLNVTEPVGCVDPGVVTIEVNVTDEPNVEGFASEMRVVVVGAFCTT